LAANPDCAENDIVLQVSSNVNVANELRKEIIVAAG
jgi:hypothetical protein